MAVVVAIGVGPTGERQIRGLDGGPSGAANGDWGGVAWGGLAALSGPLVAQCPEICPQSGATPGVRLHPSWDVYMYL